jgi:hypothetical protein
LRGASGGFGHLHVHDMQHVSGYWIRWLKRVCDEGGQ